MSLVVSAGISSPPPAEARGPSSEASACGVVLPCVTPLTFPTPPPLPATRKLRRMLSPISLDTCHRMKDQSVLRLRLASGSAGEREGKYKDAAFHLNLETVLESGPAPQIEHLTERDDRAALRHGWRLNLLFPRRHWQIRTGRDDRIRRGDRGALSQARQSLPAKRA